MAKINFVTQRKMMEGTAKERAMETQELKEEVSALMAAMPKDSVQRQTYIRELVVKVTAGQMDKKLFVHFVDAAGALKEVQACIARVRLVAARG